MVMSGCLVLWCVCYLGCSGICLVILCMVFMVVCLVMKIFVFGLFLCCRFLWFVVVGVKLSVDSMLVSWWLVFLGNGLCRLFECRLVFMWFIGIFL